MTLTLATPKLSQFWFLKKGRDVASWHIAWFAAFSNSGRFGAKQNAKPDL
jgi:hypothetical protein